MDLTLATFRFVLIGTFLLGVRLDQAQAAARAHDHASVFIPVLIYHHVKLTKPNDNAIERGLTISPAQFEAELSYLSSHRYHTVTAAQLVSHLRTGTALPPKPVVLTFDDGYVDMYAGAFVRLRKHHMVATFFIVPGFLGGPRYLSWHTVQDMAAHGMDIEAHTMTHPDLTVVPLLQARGELNQSRQVLQARLHRSVRIFCYPYGAYNGTVLREVARAGYVAAFTTHQGWIAKRGQLLTLPRVYVDSDDSLAAFGGRLRADAAVLAADPT